MARAVASFKDTVEFALEQEGTKRGTIKPGQCKYFVYSRITGIYIVIIRCTDEGEILIVERRVKGPFSRLFGGGVVW